MPKEATATTIKHDTSLTVHRITEAFMAQAGARYETPEEYTAAYLSAHNQISKCYKGFYSKQRADKKNEE